MEDHPRMNTVLERAATVATGAGVEVIGVVHVFLSILDEKDSIPTQVMDRLGLVDQLRAELWTILEIRTGHPGPAAPPPA